MGAVGVSELPAALVPWKLDLDFFWTLFGSWIGKFGDYDYDHTHNLTITDKDAKKLYTPNAI